MEAMHENRNSTVVHPNDPRFLNLRSLQTPHGRSRSGLYLIEGIRHVARAVEDNAPIQSLFYAPSILSSPFGSQARPAVEASGCASSQTLAERLSTAHTCSESARLRCGCAPTLSPDPRLAACGRLSVARDR